jgi:hypothetical protein
MTETSPAWPRPYWTPGDEKAVLVFYVFGKFDAELVIPSMRYQSPGLPQGIEIQRFQNAVLRQWDGYPLQGALGEILHAENPEVAQQARIAPEVLVVRGEIEDRNSLDYLHDTLGVLAALLDVGGTSILDPQILSLFSADQWRQRYLVPGGAPPRNHVLILCNADEVPDRSWVRTRGMRKFGRPDLSVRNVPENELGRAGSMCERLMEFLSMGGHFRAGQELAVDGLSTDMVAEPGGGPDDPQFNNTHVAFHWPD